MQETAEKTEIDPIVEIFDDLSHEIRVKIIKLIYDNVEMSYSEILNQLKIGEGLLNFHLRKIKKFLKPTEDGRYILSEEGRLAYRLINFAEMSTHSSLKHSNTKIYLAAGLIINRILAFAIDVIILLAISGLLLSKNFRLFLSNLLALNIDFTYFFSRDVTNLLTMMYDLSFGAYAYFTLMEAYKGQTLGKYLLKIRVIKADGSKISILDSAVRNIGKVFLLPLDVLLGVLFYSKRGYLKFFDFYTNTITEKLIK